MNDMTPYTYTILRYVHDITSGEFINVGVAIHSAEAVYAKIKCRHTVGRLSKVFPSIKQANFKSTMRYIENSFNVLSNKKHPELQFNEYKSVMSIAQNVLPEDDSSLQWSPVAIGRARNLDITLEKLFERMVLRYDEKNIHDKRSEEDVWKHFKSDLEKRHLLQLFTPKKIKAKDDELEFSHTWKNGIFHCLEPVSFDLSSTDYMKEKAHKWLGRLAAISDSPDKFKVYFLVGPPQDESLIDGYNSAVNLLKKSPVAYDIIPEDRAEYLTNLISEEVEKHEALTLSQPTQLLQTSPDFKIGLPAPKTPRE